MSFNNAKPLLFAPLCLTADEHIPAKPYVEEHKSKSIEKNEPDKRRFEEVKSLKTGKNVAAGAEEPAHAAVVLPVVPKVASKVENKPVEKVEAKPAKEEIVDNKTATEDKTKPMLWSQLVVSSAPSPAPRTTGAPATKPTTTTTQPAKKGTSPTSKFTTTTEDDTTPEPTTDRPFTPAEYHARAQRTFLLIDDIYSSALPFPAACIKYNLTPTEAGTALAVFGMQCRQLLKDRRVFKETLLRAMAKHEEGYGGRDMGSCFEEAWAERKKEDGEKETGRNKGQQRAHDRNKEKWKGKAGEGGEGGKGGK